MQIFNFTAALMHYRLINPLGDLSFTNWCFLFFCNEDKIVQHHDMRYATYIQPVSQTDTVGRTVHMWPFGVHISLEEKGESVTLERKSNTLELNPIRLICLIFMSWLDHHFISMKPIGNATKTYSFRVSWKSQTATGEWSKRHCDHKWDKCKRMSLQKPHMSSRCSN